MLKRNYFDIKKPLIYGWKNFYTRFKFSARHDITQLTVFRGFNFVKHTACITKIITTQLLTCFAQ